MIRVELVGMRFNDRYEFPEVPRCGDVIKLPRGTFVVIEVVWKLVKGMGGDVMSPFVVLAAPRREV